MKRPHVRSIVTNGDIGLPKMKVRGYSGGKYKVCSILDTDYLALRDCEWIKCEGPYHKACSIREY